MDLVKECMTVHVAITARGLVLNLLKWKTTMTTNNMKSSYFQTPRTMEEAVWHPWGAAIEVPVTSKVNAYDTIIFVLAIVIVCMTIYILV